MLQVSKLFRCQLDENVMQLPTEPDFGPPALIVPSVPYIADSAGSAETFGSGLFVKFIIN